MYRVMIPEYLVDHGFDSLNDPIMYPNHEIVQWLEGYCWDWDVVIDRHHPFRLILVFQQAQIAALFKLRWC